MLAAALQYGDTPRHFYHLHAWVIMPNHVHMVLGPLAAMPAIMRWSRDAPACRALSGGTPGGDRLGGGQPGQGGALAASKKQATYATENRSLTFAAPIRAANVRERWQRSQPLDCS
jgi:REP element-mobilizing transposase RayT